MSADYRKLLIAYGNNVLHNEGVLYPGGEGLSNEELAVLYETLACCDIYDSYRAQLCEMAEKVRKEPERKSPGETQPGPE